MKIVVIAVGKIKKSPQLDLCTEYIKRMGWKVTVHEVDSPKAASSAIEEPLILKNIPDDAFIVALDERGKTFSSPEFAQNIEKWREQAAGNTLYFIIGGADGLTDAIREKSKILLSFGKQTWPHMLVRVMLLEQMYRAQQILAGHPYHRG